MREVWLRLEHLIRYPPIKENFFQNSLGVQGDFLLRKSPCRVLASSASSASCRVLASFAVEIDRKDGQVLPVEGLVREGNALRPTGFPLEETALALLTRIGDLEAQLSVLKEKEAKRADAPSLFS